MLVSNTTSSLLRTFASPRSAISRNVVGCLQSRSLHNEHVIDRNQRPYGPLKQNKLIGKFNTCHRQIHISSRLRMFIQVEETPNPNSLKFYPGETVLEAGTVDFQDKTQASLKSPLAKALFRIKGVKSVFFAQDFITVSKEDDEKSEWNVLKPQIFSAIMIFYTMKQPILYDSVDKDPNEINEADSAIVKEIKQLITDKIRPTIQEDGGDLEFVSFEDSIVRVRLQGACTSCPSSVVTLKNGIKNMLQYYIPEVMDVEQVSDEV